MGVVRVPCQLCGFSIQQTRLAFEVHLLRHKLDSKLEFFINLHLEIQEPDYSIEKILKDFKEKPNRQTFNAVTQTQDLGKDSPIKNKKCKSRTSQTNSQTQSTQTDLNKQTNQLTQTKVNGCSVNQGSQTEGATTPEDSTTTRKENQGSQTEATASLQDNHAMLKENRGTKTEATTKLDDNLEDLESHAVSEVDDFDAFSVHGSEGSEFFNTETHDEHETDSATLNLPSTRSPLLPSPVQTTSWVDFGIQCSALYLNKNTQTLGKDIRSESITTQTSGLIQVNSISVQTNVSSRNQYTYTEVPFLTNASTQCVPNKSVILLDELSSDGNDSSFYSEHNRPVQNDDIEEEMPYLELSQGGGIKGGGEAGDESGQPSSSTPRSSTYKNYLEQFTTFVTRRKSLEYFDSGKIESEPEEEEIDPDTSNPDTSDTDPDPNPDPDSSKEEVIEKEKESTTSDLKTISDTNQRQTANDKKRKANILDYTKENEVNGDVDTSESVEQDLQNFLSETGSHKISFLKRLYLKPRSPSCKRKRFDSCKDANLKLRKCCEFYYLPKLTKEPRVILSRSYFPTLRSTFIDDTSGHYIKDIIPVAGCPVVPKIPTPKKKNNQNKNKRKIKNSNVSRLTRMRKRSSNKLDNLDGDKHVIGRSKSNKNNTPLLSGHMEPPFKPVTVESPTADEWLYDLAKEHIQRQGRT